MLLHGVIGAGAATRTRRVALFPWQKGGPWYYRARMANRLIHYEAAFEDFLRSRGTPYVAVDEAKKALFAEAALKSFDFVVYSAAGANLLVDVKGRKFPYVSRGRKRYWENWVEQDDLTALARWQEIFGAGFQAVLVFAYLLGDPGEAAKFVDVHLFRQEFYGFLAVPCELYGDHSRLRSPSWRTFSMPTGLVRELAAPATSLL